MRSTSIATITELARDQPAIHLLTADLGFKVLDPFRQAFPTRFTNVGVQEANMISVAAGLALGGKKPICYSMVPFLFFRAFEQVRLDVVEPGLTVILLGVGGGLSYGHEGPSHHAIEDLAIARSLPGLQIIAPGDPAETALALKHALESRGPTFIRLGRNGDPKVHERAVSDILKPITVTHQDSACVLFATGHILDAAKTACTLLEARGLRVRLVSLPTLKPFPEEEVRAIVRSARAVFTVEEHSIVGGLGTQLAEVLLAERYKGPILKIGLPDAYCTRHGSLEWLRSHYGIDPEGIARKVAEHAS